MKGKENSQFWLRNFLTEWNLKRESLPKDIYSCFLPRFDK